MNSKVILIGAGPGDPELLTLAAYKRIQTAHVILYDALVTEAILELNPSAQKIYVGKRKGQHALNQDEINHLIVQQAKTHGEIVRLKGGDPFVFGRGGEELLYAKQHGVDVEVIPGISSSLGVPANQHLPLTSRGDAKSFWVLTATTLADNELPKDVTLAAQSSATVVILMGMHHIRSIVQHYRRLNKNQLGIAIIQNGTRTNETIYKGYIHNFLELHPNINTNHPGIIVIGQVVNKYLLDTVLQHHNTDLNLA